MKNHELIRLLGELPAGADVWVALEGTDEMGPVAEVWEDENGDIVIRDFTL